MISNADYITLKLAFAYFSVVNKPSELLFNRLLNLLVHKKTLKKIKLKLAAFGNDFAHSVILQYNKCCNLNRNIIPFLLCQLIKKLLLASLQRNTSIFIKNLISYLTKIYGGFLSYVIYCSKNIVLWRDLFFWYQLMRGVGSERAGEQTAGFILRVYFLGRLI